LFTSKKDVRILNPQKNLWDWIFSWFFGFFRIFQIFADLNPQRNLWIFWIFADFPDFFLIFLIFKFFFGCVNKKLIQTRQLLNIFLQKLLDFFMNFGFFGFLWIFGIFRIFLSEQSLELSHSNLMR
jgi:hypothetical protein